MRFSIAALSALVAIVSAQSLTDLPTCAQGCVGNSLSTTGCNGLQIGCICASSGWIAGLSCCVKDACNTTDQQTTIKFASQLCLTYGVTTPTDINTACAAKSGNSTASGSASASKASASATATTAKTGGANKEYVGAGLGVAAAGILAALF